MKIPLLTLLALCSSVLVQAQTASTPDIRVTLLGTGVPYVDSAYYVASGRVTAGLLIEAGSERMLFDVGQGIVTRLMQSGGSVGAGAMDPNIGVDKVFISHLHSDHIADLASLYMYGWLVGRFNVPLRVWGPGWGPNQPIGTSSMMQQLRVAFDTDYFVRCCLFTAPDAFNVPISGVTVDNNVIELWPDVVYTNNGVTVTAFLVDHHPVEPSYGFRIEYKGHSVVFSGDTTFSPNLVAHSKGADLLIHEVWGLSLAQSSSAILAYHTTPEQAATVFNMTAPKMAVFTHIGIPQGTTTDALVARTRAAGYTGPLTVGRDLMKIDITGSNIVVTPASFEPEKPAASVPAEVYEFGRQSRR